MKGRFLAKYCMPFMLVILLTDQLSSVCGQDTGHSEQSSTQCDRTYETYSNERIESLMKEMLNEIRQQKQQLSGCPSGFTYVSDVNGCYQFVSKSLTWDMAAIRCQTLHKDAHLVFVNNANEHNALKSFLHQSLSTAGSSCAVHYPWLTGGVWMGGQRYDPNPSTATEFVWRSAPNICASLREITYTAWDGSEPNNHRLNESCIHVVQSLNYAWNDLPCELTQCALCEVDLA